jgi:HEAT repeat protein
MKSEAAPSEPNERVAGLLDDFSRPGQAIEEVLALGAPAVEPLRRYLAGSPQSVPHARHLAVRLLGLIGGDEAEEGLREVLRQHDLRSLAPTLAMSEYVVKNEAVEQLMLAGRHDLADDFLHAFRRDRLPAAADALTRLQVTAAIADLVEALEDDLLAERAAGALRQFGAAAEVALVHTLAERHSENAAIGESRVSRRRRVAAAMLLGEIGGAASGEPLRAMALASDPTVRAAAAVALYHLDAGHISPQQVRAIVAGGMSPEWRVRERCRETASAVGAPCIPAALGALRATTIPDLYGVPQPLLPQDRRWLVPLVLENAGADVAVVDRLLDVCEPPLLAEGLVEVDAPQAAVAVGRLHRHRDPVVREAVAQALGRLGSVTAVPLLVDLLSDPKGRVRAAAARALRALAAVEPEHVAPALSELRGRGRWSSRLRVWWALRHTAKRPLRQA